MMSGATTVFYGFVLKQNTGMSQTGTSVGTTKLVNLLASTKSLSLNVFDFLKIAYEITNHAHKFKSCISECLLLWSKFDQKSCKWAYKTMRLRDVIS